MQTTEIRIIMHGEYYGYPCIAVMANTYGEPCGRISIILQAEAPHGDTHTEEIVVLSGSEYDDDTDMLADAFNAFAKWMADEVFYGHLERYY